MTYDDFEIRISQVGTHRLSIRVDCEAGEDTVEVEPEFGPGEGQRLFAEFGAAVKTGQEGRNLVDLGRRLFSFLFPQAHRSLWDRCRGNSLSNGRGLRLRIHLDLARPELAWLAALPWELLFDEESGGFLALDGRTPVVRYLDLRRDRRPFPKTRPWRVLVVMSDPAGTPPLNLHAERQELLEIWGRGQEVELIFPEGATFDAIRRELTRRPIHGIHYMGHALFDEQTGWSGLLLEAPSGGGELLLGPAVKKLVQGVEPPALVVLNSCNTGRTGPEPFGGAAAALMDAGVPAVVAMQLRVGDDEAIHFSKILYRALQDGHPVDWAVSEARLSLSQAFRNRPAWAIPALFMRVPDGRLFEDKEESSHEPQSRPEVDVIAEAEVERVKGGEITTTGVDGLDDSAGGGTQSPLRIRTKTKIGSAENTPISTVGVRKKGHHD